MTNPGDINKPNLIAEISAAAEKPIYRRVLGDSIYGYTKVCGAEAAMGVIEVLRRRGLINSLGLEILDRDSGETK